jgi:hypothetical protein
MSAMLSRFAALCSMCSVLVINPGVVRPVGFAPRGGLHPLRPLNVRGNTSPWRKRVSAARRVMAADARAWAAARGLPIAR